MIRLLVFACTVLTTLLSTSSFAQESTLSVMLNKQTYQFERPLRLSSVLSLIAENGDWYWPTAAVFNLTDTHAEDEKAAILIEIRDLMTRFDRDSDTFMALENLYEQVATWTVSTRIDMPVSYNRARLFFEENPMFQPGKYWIRLNGRPNVVHFSGAVIKPGAYQHQSNTSVYTAVDTVKKAVDADRSYVYIITPQGNVEERGIAYWNLDFSQLMPGSQVYVPISPELFSNKLKVLNKRVAALAVHRVLPQ